MEQKRLSFSKRINKTDGINQKGGAKNNNKSG
jgi:hypothetical protein